MFWGLFFSPRHQISVKSAKCKMAHAAGVIRTFSLDAFDVRDAGTQLSISKQLLLYPPFKDCVTTIRKWMIRGVFL